jgi:hypothetical protein
MTAFKYTRTPGFSGPDTFVAYGHEWADGKVTELTDTKLQDAPDMAFAVRKLSVIQLHNGFFTEVEKKKVAKKTAKKVKTDDAG